jgi:hypothetical protein
MNNLVRWAGALVVVATAGAALFAPSEASAVIVRTKISLAELKEVYNLSSIRRLVDPTPGDSVSFYMTGSDKKGVPISKDGKKIDLSKSFVFFRVNTKRASDPVFSIGQADVQFASFRRPHKDDAPIVRVSCVLRGSTSAGIRSVTCGGRTVSPT